MVARMMNLKQILTSVWMPFVLGIVIRFSLAPFTEQRWDMYIWRLNQAFVYGYRINPFWPDPGAPLEFAWGYPPLWLLTLLILFPMYFLMSPMSFPGNASALWNPYPWSGMTEMFESYNRFIPPNLPVLDLVIKTPIIIADVLTVFFIYKIIRSTLDERKARYAAWALLLNPYVIWISSVWGSFDAIPTLFVVVSLYYFIQNKYDRSAIALSIGILFKLYPIVLVPVLGLIAYKRAKEVRLALRYILIAGGITLAVAFGTYCLFILFAGQDPVSLAPKLMFGLLIKRASPDWLGQNAISGLTPLVVLRDLVGTSNIPVSPILMTSALSLILLSLYRMKTITLIDIISYSVVTHLMIFMTYSVVNPQYLTWVLPLLVVLYALKPNWLLEGFFWVLSLVGIIALVSSYDLSYNISPVYVSTYLGMKIPPELMGVAIGLALLYLTGMKLALRKPNNRAPKAPTKDQQRST